LVGLIIRHTALTSFFDLEFYSVLHVWISSYPYWYEC
jgi:hypothetical protein